MTDDDDNPEAVGSDDEAAGEAEEEDPLLSSIDDLEGRVVSSLDDFKLHPGVRTNSAAGSPNVHDEIQMLLRPVLEIAAHVAPATGRSHAAYRAGGVDQSVEECYQRLNSDL